MVFFGSDRYSLIHLSALKERERTHKDVHVAHIVTVSVKTSVAQFCTKYGFGKMCIYLIICFFKLRFIQIIVFRQIFTLINLSSWFFMDLILMG